MLYYHMRRSDNGMSKICTIDNRYHYVRRFKKDKNEYK